MPQWDFFSKSKSLDNVCYYYGFGCASHEPQPITKPPGYAYSRGYLLAKVSSRHSRQSSEQTRPSDRVHFHEPSTP